MIDTIGADAGNIPAGAVKVAGYVTGTPDIIWPASAWARFPRAGKVRIDQSPGLELYAAGKADVADIESLAGTAASFAMAAAERHHRGEGNTVYASRSTMDQVPGRLAAVPDLPPDWWHGTRVWLANPSLSLAEASSLIGTEYSPGLDIVAVQWATPGSNPDTAVGSGTCKTLNVDLSVARDDWFPGTSIPAWHVQALNLARSVNVDSGELVKLLEDNLS